MFCALPCHLRLKLLEFDRFFVHDDMLFIDSIVHGSAVVFCQLEGFPDLLVLHPDGSEIKCDCPRLVLPIPLLSGFISSFQTLLKV